MTDFTLTSGADQFTGDDTENNTVFGAADDLSSQDVLQGSATDGIRDTLRFTAPGSVETMDLASVTNFERVDLAIGGISVALTDALVTGGQSSEFGVGGSSGNDVLDFSAVVTATAAIRVALRGGTDTLIGSAGGETLQVRQGDLDATDTIDAGAGFDVLSLLDGVTVALPDLTNVSGFERVAFFGDGNITVDDAFVASGPFTFSNIRSNVTSDQTVDASAVTGQTLAFQTRGGDDTLIGGAGKNTYEFDLSAGELDGADTIDGSAGSRDTLVLRGDGDVTAADLAGVTGVEVIRLVSSMSATVELTDDLLVNNRIQIDSRSGDNEVDASAVTGIARFRLDAGSEIFQGGTGNDNALFRDDALSSADTLDGGDGIDTLTLTRSGTIEEADLANVTNFEQLALRDGGSVTLADGVATGSTFRVFGTGAADTVDASAETAARILFRNVSDDDTLTGGAANDRFDLESTGFTAIDGGAGDLNTLLLTDDTAALDLTDAALSARISNIQVVSLGGTTATLTLDSGAISAVSGAGNELYVTGNTNDSVTLDGQFQLVGPTTNADLDPGATFDEYRAPDGATVFVQSNITVTAELSQAPSDIALDNMSADENVDGAVIGALTVTDANAAEIFTFATDDARFEVVGDAANGYQLQLVAGTSLDAEQALSVPVEITVTDSAGLTRVETFDIAVTDLDDNATTAPADVSIAEDSVAENATAGTFAGIQVSSTDADVTAGDIAYAITGGTGQGQFEIDADGNVVVAQDAAIDFEATPSLTIDVQATPANGAPSQTATFTIAVGDVNDVAPMLDQNSNIVAEGTNAPLVLTATDADTTGEASTFSIVAGGDGAFFEIVGNQLRFIEAPDFEAAADADGDNVYEVNVDVSDGVNTRSQSVSVTVTDVNEAPAVVALTGATDEDASATFDLLAGASDPENGSLAAGNLTQIAGAPVLAVINEVNELELDASAPGLQELAVGETTELAFTFDVSDGTNEVANTITVTVTGTNDMPQLDAAIVDRSANEDAAFSFAVPAGTFSDVDGDDLTLSATLANGDPLPSWLTFDAATGTFSGTPEQSDVGTLSVEVTATDPSSATATDTFDLTVNAVDDAPVALDADFTAAPASEDALVDQRFGIDIPFAALASDVDSTIDADSFTFDGASIDGQPVATLAAAGISYDDQTGDFVLDPTNVTAYQSLDDGESVDVVVDFTVSADGQSDQGSATFRIAGANDVPVVTGAVALTATDEDEAKIFTQQTLLANASDIDGDVLTVANLALDAASAGAGTVTDNGDGSFVFTPAADFNGDVTFTYDVSDGDAAAATTATLTVEAVNDAPVAQDFAADQAVPEDTPAFTNNIPTDIPFSDLVTDVDGDAFTRASFDFQSATIGGRPVATLAAAGITYDAQSGDFTFDPSSVDAYQALVAGETTDVVVTFEVTDPDGLTDTGTATFTVSGADDAPVIAGDATGDVTEDDASNEATGTLTIDDDDANQSSFVAQSGTAGTYGTFSIEASGAWIYTLDNSLAATDALAAGASEAETFTVTTADGTTTDVTVTVSGANDAPVAAADQTVSSDENVADTVVLATASAMDADAGDAITYAILTGDDASGLFEVDASTGEVSLATGAELDAEAATSYDVTVTATDNAGASDTQTITIDVNDLDDNATTAPGEGDGALNEVDENAATGALVGISVSSTDADVTAGDISYAITGGDGNEGLFSVDANGDVRVAGAIDREAVGSTVTIEITATPANGAASTASSFAIAINDVDEFDVSPVTDTDDDANGNANQVDENAATGTTVGITAQASDDDATTNGVTYAITGGTGQGLFAIDANGVVTVDGAIDREATGDTLSVEVTATSADGSSSVASFDIAVADIEEFRPDTPTDADADANEVSETAAAGSTVGITAMSDDQDATDAILQYAITGGTGQGLFDIAADGVVTLNANGATMLDFDAGPTSYTLEIRADSDDGNASLTQTFTVNVTDENDNAPVIISAAALTQDENVQPSLTLTATDADTTGEATTFAIAGGADAALFEIVNGNELRLVSAPDFENPADAGDDNVYDVQVTASDGTNVSAAQDVAFTVENVNEAPVANDDSLATTENTTAAGNVLGNDTDEDGDAVSVADFSVGATTAQAGGSITLANGAQLSVAANGAVTLSQNGAFEALAVGQTAQVAFTYNATDGALTDGAAAIVTVAGANDAPVANADVDTLDLRTDADGKIKLALQANDTDIDQGDTFNFSSIAGTLVFPGTAATIPLTDGTLEYDGTNVTFVAGDDFDDLADGEAAVVTFSYEITDSQGDSGTANATVIVLGENNAPTLDLDTTDMAGNDYDATGPAVSSTADADAAGALAIQTGAMNVADVDGANDQVSQITATLAGFAGTDGTNMTIDQQNGAGGSRGTLGLTAAGQNLAAALDVDATFVPATGVFTLDAASPITQDQANRLLDEVRYANDETTFALDTDGRSVSVTVTDAGNATSDAAIFTVPVSAVVSDTTGVDAFVGTDFDDTINGQGGDDTIEGRGGDDTITGGDDDDTIVYTSGDGDDTISGNDGSDRIEVTGDATDETISVESTGVGAGTIEIGGDTVTVDTLETVAIDAAAGDDTIEVDAFNEIGLDVDGGDGTDLLDTSAETRDVNVDLTAGTFGTSVPGIINAVDTVSNVENVTTGDGDDDVTGDTGANALTTGAGNDDLTGGAGDDTLDGGADSQGTPATAEGDAAIYTGTIGTGDITVSGTGWQVAAGAEGTDTLIDIEIVESAGGRILLVGNGGFDTLQGAVDEAVDGDTVLVTGGPYDEAVTIGVGIAIVGADAGRAVDIQSITLTDAALDASGDTVSLANVTLGGDAAAAGTRLSFRDMDGDAAGTLSLMDVTIEDASVKGLTVGSQTGLTDISIDLTDVDFSGNGTSNASGGADINLFNFAGDADFADVTVEAGGGSQHAIQIAGFTGNDGMIGDIPGPIGAVRFDGVSVTGTTGKALVFINGYNDLSTLAFDEDVDNDNNAGGLTLNGTAGWTGLFVSPVSAGGMFTPATVNLPTDLDLTRVTVTGGTYGGFGRIPGNPGVFADGTPVADLITGTDSDTNGTGDVLNGMGGDDEINAGAGADLIFGGAGNDDIDGGTGNDTIVDLVGDGSDTIDGGANSALSATNTGDTLIVSNIFPDADPQNPPNPNLTATAIGIAQDATNGGFDVTVGLDANDVTNVETASVLLGDGGDTVTLTGDLDTAGLSTVAVGPQGPIGAGSGDTLDASGQTTDVTVSFDGAAGDDTFVAGAGTVAGNDDVFAGGAGTDTLDYSNVTTAVSVDLGAAGGATATGFATVSNVENVTGGGADDTLTGDAQANTLSGGAGNDDLTGGAGDDTLDGGADSQSTAANGEGDTAIYTGTIARGDITTAGTGWQVAAGTEGTDTLTDIEIVTDGTSTFLLVGNGGFDTIQAAVDEAEAGDTVLIAAGTYAENVTIDTGVTLVGLGAVVLNGLDLVDASSPLNALLVDGGAAGQSVSVENVTVNAGAGQESAVRVATSATYDALTLQDSDLSGGRRTFQIQDADGLAAVSILGTASDEAAVTGFGAVAGGAGIGISVGDFNGNVTITNVAVSAPANGGVDASYGINIAGSGAAGAISITDVTVDGDVGRGLLAIQDYADANAPTLTNVTLTGDNLETQVDFAPLYIDGVGGIVDASGVTVVDGATNSIVDPEATFNGTATAATFTGTDGTDRIVGGAVDDTLNGGDGDDFVLGATGDDDIDGGDGTDSAVFTGTSDGYSFGFDGTTGEITVTDTDTTAPAFDEGTDTLTNVENIRFANNTADPNDDSFALIVDSSGDFGSYTTINAAVADADAGDTIIVVGRGAAAYPENVVLSEGISLLGIDAGEGDGLPIIAPASGAAIELTGTFAAGETVRVENFDFDGNETATYGVLVTEAASNVDALEIVNSNFTGFERAGVAADGDRATDAEPGVASVAISATVTGRGVFTNNGDGSSGGDGDISFFVYTGDATLSGLTLTGDGQSRTATVNGTTTLGVGSQTGIQFLGDNLGSLGTVSLTDITVDGTYARQPIAFFNYDDVNGLSIDTLDVTATAGFGTSINFDGIGGDIDLTNETDSTAATFTGVTTAEPISLQGQNGTAGTNVFVGDDAAQFVRAYEGDDDLRGNGGNDIILAADRDGTSDGAGSGDIDTVRFSGSFDDYTITTQGIDVDGTGPAPATDGGFNLGFGFIQGLQITDNGTIDANNTTTRAAEDGSDLVGQAEILAFDGDDGDANTIDTPDTVRVVGAGGYESLQAAIDAADDGDIVFIANGTYDAAVVNKEVRIVGESEAGVIIDGPGNNGLDIQSDNVTLESLTVQNFVRGISVGALIEDLSIDAVTATGNDQGFRSLRGSEIDGLTITDSSFDGNTIGLYFTNDSASVASVVTNVNVSGTSFNDNDLKGIYAETLNEAVFDDIEVINSGTVSTGTTNAGIDINLKYANYEDISITNSVFEDSGEFVSLLNGTTDLSGAIQIKARDDGPSYNGSPATLDGLTITGNTIRNTEDTPGTDNGTGARTQVGIRLGETGKVNGEIEDVTITGNTITDIDVAVTDITDGSVDLDAVELANTISGTSVVTVDRTGNFELGDDLIVGAAAGGNMILSGNGEDLVVGSDADDTITGGAGVDDLRGGEGDDTFIWSVGDGGDNVDGGEGAEDGQGDLLDIEAIANNGSLDSVTFAAAAMADGTVDIDGETVTFSNLERIEVETGDGDDDIEFEDVLDAAATTVSVDAGGGSTVAFSNGGIVSAFGDTLSFQVFPSTGTGGDGVSINLSSGTFAATTTGFTGTHTIVDGANGDLGSSVETVVGSLGVDAITGDDQDNILNGNLGNDTLNGRDGADLLIGGGGDDTIFGGSGADVIMGGVGDDLLNGDAGADVFVYNGGDEGLDTIVNFNSGLQGSGTTVDQFAFNSANADYAVLAGGMNFDVLVRDVTNNTYAGSSTSPTFVIDTLTGGGQSDFVLYFDEDGDGTVDKTVTEIDSASNVSDLGSEDFTVF